MRVAENIPYKPGSTHTKHLLDVYTPDGPNTNPVLIFVHGGSWYTGCKEWYQQLGRHLAEKNIVCVVINYRLGADATYEAMADDVALAVKWTSENIHKYQGDRQKIFISGHSAGGHLSALISLNLRFYKALGITNPAKGCVLIDAFGMNMDYVMQNNNAFFVKELKSVFGNNPEKWKDAAPVKFVTQGALPFLILTGSNTYPYMTLDNQFFKMSLEAHQVPFTYKTIPGRNHTEMITSLKDPNDPVYGDILGFMENYMP